MEKSMPPASSFAAEYSRIRSGWIFCRPIATAMLPLNESFPVMAALLPPMRPVRMASRFSTLAFNLMSAGSGGGPRAA